MKKLKVIGILVFVLAVCLVLALYIFIPGKDQFTEEKSTKISFRGKEPAIYIHQQTWGMTGDHRVVFITGANRKNTSPDQRTDYIYKGFSPLFYKQKDDTLMIYCTAASAVPPDWNAAFNIVQIELANPEMMRLFDNGNYKKEQLTLIN